MPVSLAPKGAGPSAARALARSALRPPPPDADETPQSRRRHSEAGPGLKPRPVLRPPWAGPLESPLLCSGPMELRARIQGKTVNPKQTEQTPFLPRPPWLDPTSAGPGPPRRRSGWRLGPVPTRRTPAAVPPTRARPPPLRARQVRAPGTCRPQPGATRVHPDGAVSPSCPWARCR